MIASFPEHIKIIDLSADFRLQDTAMYEKWYNTPHLAPDLQKEAVYGLSEIYGSEIASARLVACPGCYPTGATLPLIPLLQKGFIDISGIIIDAKTGVTGAGRSAKQAMLFSEVNEGITPYAICAHRHMPEIEQSLSHAAGKDVLVTFTPQLVPMSRGILSTIYVSMTQGKTSDDLRDQLVTFYEDAPFVTVLPKGTLPATRNVHGTNACHIQIVPGRLPHQAIIISAIDNLTKGSSGQAVQNLNLMMGWDEATGLAAIPVFP
jgi:N-acetyl-gamma-glutamyl-phosphate reductase